MRSLGARWPRCSATCRRSGLFTSPMQLRNSPSARRGHSASGAAPAIGGRCWRTPRSTWFRSPRPTGSTLEMAVAALEAGKHVWCEKPMAAKLDEVRDDAVGRAPVGQGRHARLQLYPEPDHPPYPQAARRAHHRRCQSRPHRDGRRLHGRSCGAVPAAPRGIERLGCDRGFRCPPAVADPHLVRRRCAGDVRHGQAVPDRGSTTASRARSRFTTLPPP